jgi:hypothetical protein
MPTALALCKALNHKWLSRYGASSMSGNCGKLASMLREAMIKHGFKGYIASGIVQGFIGNHAWVVYEGEILDPSINQFGVADVKGNGLVYHEHRRMEFLL